MKIDCSVTNNVTPVVQEVKRKVPDRMYKAVAKAGGIVKKGAAILSPSRRISISLKVMMSRENGQAISRTGIKRKSKGWYGKFLEKGTEKHDIKPKTKGGKLAWAAESGQAQFGGKKKLQTYYRAKSGKYTTDISEANMIYARGVRHPGIKAKPFLRPAYEVNKKIIKDTIADAAIKTLQEAKSRD